MASIGSWAIGLSLVVSLYGAVAALIGARRRSPSFVHSARNALLAAASLVTLASLVLFYSLIAHDFQLTYVYQYTSTHLPLVYRISAFWAGKAGSMLLWLWMLAILAVVVGQNADRPGQMRPYLLAVLAVAEAFLAFLLVVTDNPFVTQGIRPAEGVGMLPLLENPGMVLHPPVLFLGYAGYTVPFAFALAALMSGELGTKWIRAMRRWNLFAWLALGTGILIGAWWSYVELGWGGYWAWDPVENASLIPWLIGTASLHAAIMEERRGMHKVWNIALPTLAYALCLFATLVTRGGIVISDLHGFATTIQPVAYYLLGFIALALGVSLSLIYRRRRQLRSDREVEALLSREGAFLLVNLLFCGAALVVFLGTTYPSLARAFRGPLVRLNASFYNRASGPLFAVVILLIGICPVLGWRRASSDRLSALKWPSLAALLVAVLAFVFGVTEALPIVGIAICSFVSISLLAMLGRDLMARRRSTGESHVRALGTLLSKGRRRYGAHLVHLAIVLFAIGIIGSTFYQREQLVGLRPGESVTLGGYTIQYEDYSVDTLNPEPVTYQSRIRYSTALSIHSGGSKLSTLVPQKSYHWALESPWVTEVAIRSSLKEDVYVILTSLEEDGLAGFQVMINPLVSWIWIGGGVLLIGVLMAAWPQRRAQAGQV
jgi:cytochrome c-type biogenesis protein CcmF